MATNIVSTNTIGAGVRITTVASTPIYVLQGVTVGSTDNSGISGTVAVDVTVAGTVLGNTGINMGVTSGFSSITVGTAGNITGMNSHAINFSDGTLSVTNYGTIIGSDDGIRYTSSGTTDGLFVANFGHIAGTSLSLGDGIAVGVAAYSVIYNYGTIGSSDAAANVNSFAFFGCANTDTLVNNGTLFGQADLGNGNDIYDGRGGFARETVAGGSGDDVLLGGAGADKLSDTVGNNWIVGGAGDDTVTVGNFGAASGVSTVYGGEVNGADTSANDTLIVSGFGANIFLGGGAVTDVPTGNVFAWAMGFENATGTSGADALIGSNGNNILQGGGGADWLVGNGGADTFRYVALSDAAAGETIADFNHAQGDVVDLAGIDANTATAGDQAFTFVTTHTNNAAAQVVLTNFGGGARIDLYVDADNVIDATIFVAYGAATTTNMTVSDFIL